MGKTFVEDERPCDQCVNRTRYGCASWDCKFIDRDEAIKAWKEKHENADRKTENSSEIPNNCEPKICDTCRYYNSNIPCGSTPSACKEADKFAEEFVDELKKLKPKDEPQRDCFLCKWLGDVDVCGRCRNRNLFAEADTEPKPKDEPQTDCPWK